MTSSTAPTLVRLVIALVCWLADLGEVKEAIDEQCRADNETLYRIVNPCEGIGLKATMEEDEVEGILGRNPIHMAENGYVLLADFVQKMVENPSTLFVGEKRMREESVTEHEETGGWMRRSHEWLTYAVSGTGKWGRTRWTRRQGWMGHDQRSGRGFKQSLQQRFFLKRCPKW